MADTASQSNFIPSPSGRADPSTGQRNLQAFRSSGGRRREADEKLAPRRSDVGTYGWFSEEVKRQGRNGRRVEWSAAAEGGRGRGGDERPISAKRWDNLAERFVPGGGLPEWSDPFPRPERIGAQNQAVLEVTGSIRTSDEPVMRQSGFAGRMHHEGTASKQREPAMAGALVDQTVAARGVGDGRSPLRDTGRSHVARARWGDSPSPDREESSSQVGELRSPLRGEPRASVKGSRVAALRNSSQGESRSGDRVVESGSPWLQRAGNQEQTSQSWYYEEGPSSVWPRSSETRSQAEFPGVDGRAPAYLVSSGPPQRESRQREKHVIAEQSAGHGSSRSFSRNNSQRWGGYGGASSGHSGSDSHSFSRQNSQRLGGYGGASSGHSGGDFRARRDGDRGHSAQRGRIGRADSREASGQQTGSVDIKTSGGSAATRRADGRDFSIDANSGEGWPQSRGDRQFEYGGGGNVEVLRSFNRGHSGRKSWGTDSPSEDDLRSIASEESVRSGKSSQSRRGRVAPGGAAENTIRRQRINQSEAGSESFQGGENRSRGGKGQAREGLRKENERLSGEATVAQALPRVLAHTKYEETFFVSSRKAVKHVREMAHDSFGRTNHLGSRQIMGQPETARRVELGNVRATWRKGEDEISERQVSQEVSPKRQLSSGLAASPGANKNMNKGDAVRELVVGQSEEDLARGSSFHSSEMTGRFQNSWGGDDIAASSIDVLPQSQAKGIGSRHGSAIYKSVAVDMGGGEGESLPSIVGSCPDMCPARERGRRERLRDLAVLERVNGHLGRTSRDLAVKKFCRTLSTSDLMQSDVRPLPVLRMTLDYLWSFLDRKDVPFKLVHDFLFDRTRSVRQDIGMQQLVSRHAISIYEEIVRFHIISERELHEQSLSDKYFDSDLNRQQLSKALFSLINMYAAYDFKDGDLPCEAEFHAYFVLLNLGKVNQNQEEALALWFSSVQRPLLVSPEMSFARDALRCFRIGNFERYFQLVRHATYLQACLLELFFNQVRAHALAVLNQSSYKLHPYPIADLAEHLLIAEEDLKSLCAFHGLPVGVQNSSQAECLLVKQVQFSAPQKASPWYHCDHIEAKRLPSHLLAVLGTADSRS